MKKTKAKKSKEIVKQKAFNRNLQNTLDQLGLERPDAAKLCGKDVQWLNRRIRGETKTTDEDYALICKSLRVKPPQVLPITLLGIDTTKVDADFIDLVISDIVKAIGKSQEKVNIEKWNKWASFLFTAANKLKLDMHQIRDLADLIVKFDQQPIK